jgi:PAS domain S-box-containing protein
LFLSALIEEKRQQANVLIESEARFRTLADTAPVMIWVSGPDKECTFLNKEWLDFTGRSLDEELGSGWAASVHRDDLDHYLEIYVDSFDARQMFTMEYRLRRSVGEYRWVLDNGVPRFAPDDTFLGYIGSCTDVTGLKRAQEALRESQKRYRIATEAGRVGIWDLNLETREIYIDPRLKAVLGFKPDEIRNHFDDWSQRVHPEDIDSAMALMQAHIRGEASSYEFEHRMLHKDGSTRWFLARGRLPRHEDGTVRHLLGTYTDITERKEAEVEVERQRNELAHLSRVTMLGTLSGSLAHELNQPLTAILSNAQAALRLLAREGANLKEVRDTLNDIVEDNRRASDIIRRLRLLLKKGDSHHLPLAINELVQDTLKLVHRDLVSNRVTVHTQLAL